jgi:hypothetical protein
LANAPRPDTPLVQLWSRQYLLPAYQGASAGVSHEIGLRCSSSLATGMVESTVSKNGTVARPSLRPTGSTFKALTCPDLPSARRPLDFQVALIVDGA